MLLWGGKDKTGAALTYAEIYDPETRSFRLVSAQPPKAVGAAQVAATIPVDGAENVPADALLSLRFSAPMRMQSLNANTLTLSGPDGPASAGAAGAEGGMLAFLTPKTALGPGTSYTVSVSGAADAGATTLPDFSFSFTTVGQNPSAGEVGLPTGSATWSGGPKNSPWAKLPALEAPPEVTAISGQVLLQDGMPLKDVTLRVSSDAAKSDGTGRFLLRDVPAGLMAWSATRDRRRRLDSETGRSAKKSKPASSAKTAKGAAPAKPGSRT